MYFSCLKAKIYVIQRCSKYYFFLRLMNLWKLDLMLHFGNLVPPISKSSWPMLNFLFLNKWPFNVLSPAFELLFRKMHIKKSQIKTSHFSFEILQIKNICSQNCRIAILLNGSHNIFGYLGFQKSKEADHLEKLQQSAK